MPSTPPPFGRRAWLASMLVAGASVVGCAGFGGDPPRVQLAGLELLPSEGLELRLALKLRVQNPNASMLSFDGVSLELDLDRRRVASGVAPVQGRVPGYGEQVVTLPVTASALELARGLIGRGRHDGDGPVEYVLRGHLGGVLPGGARFETRGTIGRDLLRR